MSEQWYYGQGGVQKGPVDSEVMRQLIAAGQVRPDDLVWKEGMANWVPASTVAEFFPQAAAPFTPVTPTPPTDGLPPPTVGYQSNPGYPQAGGPTLGYQQSNPTLDALRSKATTSMVLGICSIVPGSCLCAFVGVGLGIGAIVMSKQAAGAPNEGAAKAGFICGIVGIVFSALSLVFGILLQFAK